MALAKSNPTEIRVPKLTDRQREMIEHPARVLWVGTATKVGKTTAAGLWIVDGILKGERCAVIGPWHQRTKAIFELVKSFLSAPLQSGYATALETTCQIRTKGGGRLDSYSGDNPEAIYGDSYHRVVIDEASRQTEKSLTAALTTVSSTGGRIKVFYNVERGFRNWAVANLLRVRAMSEAERSAAGEDFMTFATADAPFVDAGLIEQMRGKMPDAIWRALYLGEIPTDDLSLFRALGEIFVGTELTAPAPGRTYHMGADLARKADWTVLTIQDDLGNIVACDRFSEISWSLQVQRTAALFRRFRCARAIVDATGIGDPVIEELRKQSLTVDPFMFTGRSKKELVENLIVACDARQITIPATPRFEVYRQEMEAFEYQFSANGEIRYSAPPGMHDDTVMSLALATHQLRSGYSVSHELFDRYNSRIFRADAEAEFAGWRGTPHFEKFVEQEIANRLADTGPGEPVRPVAYVPVTVGHLQHHERGGLTADDCTVPGCPYGRIPPE